MADLPPEIISSPREKGRGEGRQSSPALPPTRRARALPSVNRCFGLHVGREKVWGLRGMMGREGGRGMGDGDRGEAGGMCSGFRRGE